MKDLVNQRIKYLVEYGELYPNDDQANIRKVMWMVLGLIAMQIVTAAILLVR